MIPAAAQRHLTRWWAVGTDVGGEVFYIMRLVRVLLSIFLVLFTCWGVLSVGRDAIHLYRAAYSEDEDGPTPRLAMPAQLESTQIVRAILIGTLVFIIPRVVWFYMPSWSDLFSMSSTTVPPPTTAVPVGQQSYAAGALLHGSINSDDWVEKYERALTDVAEYAVHNLKVTRQDRIDALLEPTRHLVRKLRRAPGKEVDQLPLRVFLFGRKDCGKSSLISALPADEIGDSQVVAASSSGRCVVTETLVHLTDCHRPVLFVEMPAMDFFTVGQVSVAPSSSFLSALFAGLGADGDEDQDCASSVMKVMCDYISRTRTPPDMAFCLTKSTEMHTSLGADLVFIRECIRRASRAVLVPIRCPLTVLATHTDSLYPADLKRACDYDNEKLQSIDALKSIADKVRQEVDDQDGGTFVDMPTGEFVAVALKNFDSGRRDYRYNVEAVVEQLKGFCTKKTSLTEPPRQHTYFCLQLVDVLSRIAKATAEHEVTLLTKCQWYAFIVVTIAFEFSSPANSSDYGAKCPTFDPTDPASLADAIKDFWLVLGMQQITKLSLAAMAEELLRQVPILGDVVVESASAGGWNVTVAHGVRRVGRAAVAYFVERRPKSSVREAFLRDD